MDKTGVSLLQDEGNSFFIAKDYQAAIRSYSKAIERETRQH
jgi:hypothetical protein